MLVRGDHERDARYAHQDSLPHRQTTLKNGKAKFKAAVRKHLNTHSSHTLYEFFYT